MITTLGSLHSASIQFKTEIRHSDASSIFEVQYRGTRYALKVVSIPLPRSGFSKCSILIMQYHNNGDPGLTKEGRSLSRFRNEANAYESLDTFGICDTGHVPKYHGSIEQLDPLCHQPWLNSFLEDKFHPTAILLEYLGDSEPLNCVNYSKERHGKAMEALALVHTALVVHNDVYPRNILIVSLERVVLIDFDIAKTFPNDCHELVQACEWELRQLEDFGKALVSFTTLPQIFLAVPDMTIRKRIKRRGFLLTQSTTRFFVQPGQFISQQVMAHGSKSVDREQTWNDFIQGDALDIFHTLQEHTAQSTIIFQKAT